MKLKKKNDLTSPAKALAIAMRGTAEGMSKSEKKERLNLVNQFVKKMNEKNEA